MSSCPLFADHFCNIGVQLGHKSETMKDMWRKINQVLTKDYIFIVLFCFSVYDVIPLGRNISHLVLGNRIIGAGIWLIALGLLFCVLWDRRGGVKEVIERHKLDFTLGIWILAGVLISCLVNFDWKGLYWPHSAVLMASALACYSFLIISLFLFLLKDGNKGYVILLVFLLIVNLIPWWQRYDYDSIKPFIRYTLAGNLFDVSSVLRMKNIYGPFAAICAIFFLGRAFCGNKEKHIRLLEGLVALCASFGVVLSSSGAGIVGLFVGLSAIFWRKLKNKKFLIIAGIIAVIVFHVFVVQDSREALTIRAVFPYMQKLHDREKVEAEDFIPNLSSSALSKRPQIWAKALSLWGDSPWLGIGLGQYNVGYIGTKFDWVTNVHNVYLNILAECGLLVFIPFCILLGRFIYRVRSNDTIMPVLISILVMSLVDNLFDKSFPWILMCSWIVASGIEDTGQVSSDLKCLK